MPLLELNSQTNSGMEKGYNFNKFNKAEIKNTEHICMINIYSKTMYGKFSSIPPLHTRHCIIIHYVESVRLLTILIHPTHQRK